MMTELTILIIMARMIAMANNPPLTVTATEAKTRFGPLLEAVIAGGSVIITKHDTPKAVLLSIAEF
jgi:prevent-host-death family protein